MLDAERKVCAQRTRSPVKENLKVVYSDNRTQKVGPQAKKCEELSTRQTRGGSCCGNGPGATGKVGFVTWCSFWGQERIVTGVT